MRLPKTWYGHPIRKAYVLAGLYGSMGIFRRSAWSDYFLLRCSPPEPGRPS